MYSSGTAVLPGNPINVLDPKRGVRGDSNSAGTSGTDDAAAINAAIAEAPNGSAVYFPRTSGAGYLLGSALICDHDDISLIFEPGSKLILAPGANTNVIRGNPNSDTATYGVVRKKRIAIQGLYAEMNGASQATGVTGANPQDGCVVLPGFDVVDLERCYVHNSKTTAYELRGSSVVRARFCVADSVYSGNAGNGFSVGKTGSVNGTDAILMGCLATGVQDVAFWLGGFGANRMQAIGCDVRGDPMRYFADGAITAGGSGTLTSATAGFTPNDVGKRITITGAGPAGADLTVRIFSYTNATTVNVSVAASTTVTGALFFYGADGAPARQVADAAMTSGSNQITSATANFTAADIQKGILVVGAAAGGANRFGKITAVTSTTQATVDFNAGTTVSGKIARINCTSSGIVSEGSTGNSRHLTILGGHVTGTVNIGAGASDANTATVGSKHDQMAVSGVTVSDTYGYAMWLTGTQHSLGETVIDDFHDSGLLLGGGNDFEERDFTLNGGTIRAASDATGPGLVLQKDGSLTNWMRSVTLNGTILEGNAGGTYGLKVEGKVRSVDLIGVQSTGWKRSGAWIGAKNGGSPQRVRILGGGYTNNNQGGNAAGQDSVGIAVESAADAVTIIGATATDDQTVKTQTHGLHWLGATRGRIKHCDFRGNATGAISATFDTLTVYDGNIEVDDAYEGGTTLVAGTATVSTAAVKNSGSGGSWTQIDLQILGPSANAGALYVSAVSSGTSFTVKSTNASDTSTFFWRIRTHK